MRPGQIEGEMHLGLAHARNPVAADMVIVTGIRAS
jgi:hypothetical protein